MPLHFSFQAKEPQLETEKRRSMSREESSKVPSFKQNRFEHVLVVHEYIGGYMFHYKNKTSEADRAESEQTLRSILEVSTPWHN